MVAMSHLHDGMGREARHATWNNSIAEFPVLVGRRDLPADPARRRDPLAVRHRANSSVDASAGAGEPSLIGQHRENAMDIAVLLVTMFFCFFIGVPIAYSLALAAIAGCLWIGIPLEAVMLKISDGVSKVAMLTIPFFVLAGAIMAEGGMARRLVAFADVLVGFTRVRGGLSVVNVLATTFLSGISGSAVADTSAIGSVMIPQMEKSGYPRVFATNVTITASVQALLVPPSHNAVIYSLATGGTISIISLFMAGVVPGLLLGFSLMVLCVVIAYRDGHPRGTAVPLREAVKITIEAVWGLITLVIILGGILGGVFTAIEAGAVACVWAFFVTMFIYRDYRWRDLPALVHRTLAHRRDGDDADRLRLERRLRDGADANAGKDHGVFPDNLEQQIRHPVPDQYIAAGSRHPGRHGAVDPDLHADSAAGDDEFRRRSGSFRHDHDAQPRHRAMPPAGRRDPVRRLRGRQGHHRRGHAQDLAVLRRNVCGADAGHLCTGAVALAPCAGRALIGRPRGPLQNVPGQVASAADKGQ